MCPWLPSCGSYPDNGMDIAFAAKEKNVEKF
jgi:hypothetical protein